MHISDVNVGNSAIAVAAQQVQAVTEMQMALGKSMAESQAQLVAMLNASGVGVQVDTQA
ncbi:MAG: hypothetical protein QNJ22_18590 [Desulfosarcinaceae bacterium]|nr:hypothetical protein [Desulfosarcinaceae bacterium]